MTDPASRAVFVHRVLVTLATASLFLPLGCSGRPGGVAFRRFWGFEQTASHDPAAGLLPKMIGQTASAECQDPFLNQDFGPATDGVQVAELTETRDTIDRPGATPDSSNAALTLFENPPVHAPAMPPAKSDAGDGNPFRLVQHETSVKEISSAEDTLPVDSTTDQGNPSPTPPNGAEQLLRLKTALNRDAKTQLAPKPRMEGAEVARQRVEAIMKNARRQMQLGEYTSALRWALAAEQLAQRSELFFGPEEDPPADLVRSLQDRLNVPPQDIQPVAKAMTEQTVPVPAIPPTSEPPALSIEFPAETAAETEPVDPRTPPQELAAVPQSATGAMREAVIAPETLTPQPVPQPIDPPEFEQPEIAPEQRHARSLKVDARRVSANQGAMVTVEGQLNPPAESPLPELELAPPAMEANVELPTVEVAINDLAAHDTTTPPPLPPPSPVSQPQPEPQPTFLYAETDSAPAPKAVKNVDWDQVETVDETQQPAWWIFPLAGVLGGLLLGFVIFKQLRR